MERLATNQTEIQHLREYGLVYPPVSFILYETTPYTYAEALFLYLVLMRRKLSEGDILVSSILENFESSLKTSAVPSPLIRKFQNLLHDPRIHYRFFYDGEELLKNLDLHFRVMGHIYVFAVDPIETSGEFIEGLSNIIRKIKNYMTRSFTITVFLDEEVMKTSSGRKLAYQAELIFRLSRGEKTPASLLRIMKTKYIESPSITLEYSIGKEDLNFQVIRTI